jgi:hypothetical protein
MGSAAKRRSFFEPDTFAGLGGAGENDALRRIKVLSVTWAK